MPRFHVPTDLTSGAELLLPPGAARHVQVLRLQPGDPITLFDGRGGEWDAQVLRMGRSDVQVAVGAHHAIEREAVRSVHLISGLMASDRMDWLVEKATELGAASFTPVLAERSTLRLNGERAEKKRAHWQAVAIAACEQSGRNRVPIVQPQLAFEAQMQSAHPHPGGQRLLLSLAQDATPLRQALLPGNEAVTFLSGPEGGLSPKEETAARAAGFIPVSLGTRVLRAETAPLAALAVILV
ncbi:16S rRNA (uracil(1498)-N(3))-methyltransferase [Ottowia thiooxydans]|uniref:16S rRNA (uracil(1498)-N(3))-methyltransferase n=1 Tax=Ottowia thiooxydans TaxID=219182 RepID=UPI00048B22AC|nr:16S rRNA (uracil(1498)-N(3))-methyltransferase [Ottowia thiooxydans]